ncbi:MAG TPA: 30S ribosome-binding factor RbfA [Gammaproteobacteria bacterium]|nr:30S ribosome-binding factor RbfA [Gammaproteobacteria bacterium]
MPREFNRTRRINEQMQRELAQLIQQEIKDPRLGMVTVSAVEVTRDLSLARVFVSVLGKESEEVDEVLAILDRAGGFLRHELGQRMKLRTIPKLRFQFDKSIIEGNRLSSLIDEAIARDESSKD